MATFSLAALTVLELAPPEMIELAARCGYEKVGLRLLPATPGGIAYRLMDDTSLLRETLRQLHAEARARLEEGGERGDVRFRSERNDLEIGDAHPRRLLDGGGRLWTTERV